jgi:hypothetical protein
MPKYVPLIGVLSALCFTGYGAVNMHMAARTITKNCPDVPPPEPDRPRGKPTEAGMRAAEPVHQSLIRMLNDLDDLLDTIQDDRSFAAVRSKLLNRAREQKAQAALHPNIGMIPLGRVAAHELQQAIRRHDKSLERAVNAVPEVRVFFEKEMAKILSPNS